MMKTTDRMAIAGAPVGALIGIVVGMRHSVWLGVIGAALGLIIGFTVGPLAVILRDILMPPKVPLSGGKRLRIWSRRKSKANTASQPFAGKPGSG